MDKNFRNDFMDKHNSKPVDDFCGFSPNQMQSILYSPLDTSCPIRLKEIITDNVLFKVPAYLVCKNLLTEIQNLNGIKLTATGNIPPKIIKHIYEINPLKDYAIEAGITKLSNEKDWIAFHSLRIVLEQAKLIRKYKGKILLTKKCISFLSKNDDLSIFKIILKTFCNEFNWAYNDSFENEYTGQFGYLFLIHLLLKYATDQQDLKFIADKYYTAFPDFQIDKDQDLDLYYNLGDFVIETRFCNRFAEWFGLIEIHKDKSKSFFERRTKINYTSLLKEIIEYHK